MSKHRNLRVIALAAAVLTAAGCAVPEAAPSDLPPLPAPSTPTSITTIPPGQRPEGMVRIPAGSYPLGRDDGPDEEGPAHRVTLNAFHIDVYPVTTRQFVDWANRSVGNLVNARGGDPRRWTGPVSRLERDAVRDQSGREVFTTNDTDEDSRVLRQDGRFAVEGDVAEHPVNEVYWWGALQYCQARGARLPTEAEWEATARGTEGRTYPWGNAAPDATRAQYGKAYDETSPVTAHPAGATPEGVRDLVGNLYEWTSSLDRPYPYAADDGREDPQSQKLRITRGSSHDERAANLRATDRDGYSRDPFAGHHHIGFRCAADA
ncbi:formylglycine-generating enzyme family protein [Crossiella cryophila]|uniref:Iron(II)-dependent oxidoreductase n=1 Tax=Crossiella cryophila TaxID=43355 RepID=A0A7W7CDX8_9PSEU|nr:SUMF1/EgtB/PvdO family nonheme iron enzyme [Crossiella cryophila]MBB4678033.1 iron(II)-dependent oxidoreductase [Crossiella cryophila]